MRKSILVAATGVAVFGSAPLLLSLATTPASAQRWELEIATMIETETETGVLPRLGSRAGTAVARRRGLSLRDLSLDR